MIDRWNGTSTTLPLLESDTEDQDRDALVRVHYLKVQPTSPEFADRFDGIDQNIDIQLSTFIFSASPRPVIALYDFIMATFVPGRDPPQSGAVTPNPGREGDDAKIPSSPLIPQTFEPTSGKIRLRLGLTRVKRQYFLNCLR